MKMLEALENYLRQRAPQRIALAYSGGVDSTLLLAVLGKMRQKEVFPVAALTMQTVLQNETEIAESKIMAERFGVRQRFSILTRFLCRQCGITGQIDVINAKRPYFADLRCLQKKRGWPA